MKNPPKNYLSSVLHLTLAVALILLGLNFISGSFLEKNHLRPIDILSDLRKDGLKKTDYDSISAPLVMDTCRNGLVCFDDFSPTHNGLNTFLDALGSKKPVRIAFFGDSFIEGDIFSGDLREKLQNRFGGNGVGMLPLSSHVNGFRQTVVHEFGGWKSYSLLDASASSRLGVGGNVFIPTENSWVYYAGIKKKPHLSTCQRVSVFYSLKGASTSIYYKINKKESGKEALIQSDKIERLNINNDSIENIGFSFPRTDGFSVYGVSMESDSGVTLDNYSMRGCSGTALKSIPATTLAQFDSLLQYDLIVLQYGLNVIEPKRVDYQKYKENMVTTIQYLQSCFSKSNFLLIGVSDRSMRKDGGYHTMPAIPAMVAAQKHICAETGIVFWNLFEAMGGENSMVKLVKSSPPKANKDYTHLTFEGGRMLGQLLYETIAYEKERYDEKNAYYEKQKQ